MYIDNSVTRQYVIGEICRKNRTDIAANILHLMYILPNVSVPKFV